MTRCRIDRMSEGDLCIIKGKVKCVIGYKEVRKRLSVVVRGYSPHREGITTVDGATIVTTHNPQAIYDKLTNECKQ